jgi:homoserine dehydrogenase
MSETTYRLILTGLGNVGRSFLEILHAQAALLRDRYGAQFVVVGAADSGGAASDPAGLPITAILAAKRERRSVATLAGVGRAGVGGTELARTLDAEIVLEATLTNLQHGQPGLDTVRSALGRGMHAVLANKGPLVLAYDELAALSDLAAGGGQRPKLRFSACVGGGLPTINLGRRDLAGCRITRAEGVLNGTTQLILRMMEAGDSYADALAEAQRRGVAEADPTLDVEGWDAANKLVILANAVLKRPTTLADLTVEGITSQQTADLQAATTRGERVVLLCLAEQSGDDYRLSVRPTALPFDHPLARMSGDEMGIVYHTDIAGRASATSAERGPGPTASAMLRDVLEIVS